MHARTIASGFGFLEGPRHRDGVIYTADFYRKQVFRIDVETGAEESLCTVPQQPSGIAFATDGSMFVVSMLDRRIMHLTGDGLREYADLSHITDHPINDMTIDRAGRLFVGAFGRREDGDLSIRPTPITRVDLDGTAHPVSMDLCYANGMAFDGCGTTFYAADTFGCRLGIFDAHADGSLVLRDFYRFGPIAYDNVMVAVESGNFLPDGISIDGSGRVWVANARAGNVGIYDPATHTAALVPIEDLNAHVYAVEVATDGRIFACVAPRMMSWDSQMEFPSRLVELTWREGEQAGLEWRPSA